MMETGHNPHGVELISPVNREEMTIEMLEQKLILMEHELDALQERLNREDLSDRERGHIEEDIESKIMLYMDEVWYRSLRMREFEPELVCT